jgi:hypothetical protein
LTVATPGRGAAHTNGGRDVASDTGYGGQDASFIFGDWRLHDLREILLHVITETACHAGHLDAARELIDGRRWLVLTD